VWAIVTGLSAIVEPVVSVFVFTERWTLRFGSFSSAAVMLASGWAMVRYPGAVLGILSGRSEGQDGAWDEVEDDEEHGPANGEP
jgi:hypothetical protein